MEDINNKSKVIEHVIIVIASIVLIYFLLSLYFAHHFFFNTVINGVNLSLKPHKKAEQLINDYIKDYELQLIERNEDIETISGQDIGMQYNKDNSIFKIYQLQNSLKWPSLFFADKNYYAKDLYQYNVEALDRIINQLECINLEVIEPKNVRFIYSNGSYEMIEEEYGNKINKEKLVVTIASYILTGKTKLDMNKKLCYENPAYTFQSKKTYETRDLLNKYVSTKITYRFGKRVELLDGNIIKDWLRVNDNLDVEIDKAAIMEFVRGLSQKYDTAGSTRSFKTSTGKTIDVKGGIYGWKINERAEGKALYDSIRKGETRVKEPIYVSKAKYHGKDDIGNTYVEINITKQHLWFYKNGELIVGGWVVTGNPNKGNSTVTGTYSIVYKEKNATLSGPGYDAAVTYWMPFYGNMGIHDARWRYEFGGEIYKSRGTHGCVNAPYYLAKTIYENIEEGTPVVIYKE